MAKKRQLHIRVYKFAESVCEIIRAVLGFLGKFNVKFGNISVLPNVVPNNLLQFWNPLCFYNPNSVSGIISVVLDFSVRLKVP